MSIGTLVEIKWTFAPTRLLAVDASMRIVPLRVLFLLTQTKKAATHPGSPR